MTAASARAAKALPVAPFAKPFGHPDRAQTGSLRFTCELRILCTLA